jgi:hypothetical protein
MSNLDYDVTVSWTKDGVQYSEEISAYGGLSSGEDSDSDDLYTEHYEASPGYLIIQGDIVSYLLYTS